MPIRNESPKRFMDEVRIISPWAYVVAALGFVVVAAAVTFAALTDKSGNTFYKVPVLIAAGLAGACAMGCYILLIGYVCADAGRRGMTRLGWTLLAIFVPNALGIVLYFVLRKPLTAHCPQCNSVVETGFGFCPRCRHKLSTVCPKCQRSVHETDKFCPYCGADVAAGASAASVPVAVQQEG